MEELFYGLTQVILLAVGIGSLIAMIGWRNQPGKRLLVAFVLVGMILVPLYSLGATVFMPAVYDRVPNYQAARIVSLVFQGIGFTLNFAAAVLLFVYITKVCRSPRGDGQQGTDPADPLIAQLVSSNGGWAERPGFLPNRDWQERFGPRWSIEIAPADQVSILRRREWALSLDVLPAILGVVGGLGVLWLQERTDFDWGRLAVFLLPFLLIFWGIYMLLKDGFAGKSIGKKLTGCRVVDFESGAPIGFGQSIARNLIMLVPLGPLVELAFASFRSDRRRLGDHLAGTIVVMGPPSTIGGVEVVRPTEQAVEDAPGRHPLDD